jgi:uncharacterized protein (TIGR02646 family)
MRYIDIRDLKPTLDSDWLKDAADAAEEVRKASPTARSGVINAHQTVWKDLKEKLRLLSYGKCWYCESIDPRSDNAVDHYRPKGNVKGASPPHDGYWWLAFDWKNYRFSCTYCNSIRTSATTSGGKQDYFPLWEENKRAKCDTDDIDNELPLLLDPLRVTHVRLIAFSEDGSIGPAVPKEKVPEYRMADETITRYHLKHPILVERRAQRLQQVRDWIEEADKHLSRYAKTPDAIALNTADARLDDIRSAASAKAEYSMAVKHLLSGLSYKSDAAKKVLDSL